MISTGLKYKIAVLCKDYYILRTIDDLFMSSGCEEDWWLDLPPEHDSARMERAFQWFAGIEENAPDKEIEILKNLCTFLIENNEILKKDKEQLETLLKLNHIFYQTKSLDFDNLHPKVQEVAGKLFQDGHYRQAILDVYIALVNTVKEKSGCNTDNVPLMQKVFSRDNPILRVSEDSDEQLGFMWLFSGAVMAVRNPKAHSLVAQDDPVRTMKWLAFASVLFEILDESKKVEMQNTSSYES
jgi:uncharacterized protein (TIGR02391 family)